MSTNNLNDAMLTTLESLFSALADRTRLEIVLFIMRNGKASVQEIARGINKSQSLVSHHLACLRNCGIVKTERKGKYVYYSLLDNEVVSIIKLAVEHAMKFSQSILACEIINEEKNRNEIETRVNLT
ncbi:MULTISPECIES: ArsR/SmtB family transcription factor [Vulcanisaeta]|uniref:Transcriptional regulator, ArsR family n=4 Tax=Vulcanisaeta TaxID=164450 RepID=E1QSF8_VULDI|nr:MULTISPECIES: metalloregulator ArsR/SmtB family transcription factor [Vulcanisaeta]ADN50751.1 transcriptional regulator, ArsR family [Vulcanisaeta distributa DSM 14429]BDR91490.1 transcriptional regulator [Vulcanisaeta souniana JCM 11219]